LYVEKKKAPTKIEQRKAPTKIEQKKATFVPLGNKTTNTLSQRNMMWHPRGEETNFYSKQETHNAKSGIQKKRRFEGHIPDVRNNTTGTTNLDRLNLTNNKQKTFGSETTSREVKSIVPANVIGNPKETQRQHKECTNNEKPVVHVLSLLNKDDEEVVQKTPINWEENSQDMQD
jgi:hypothetical protein